MTTRGETCGTDDLILETHLWFQIAVTYSLFMQYLQSLQDLPGNWNRVKLVNHPIGFHMSTQITLFNVFHGQVDTVLIFIPSEENDEKLWILSFLFDQLVHDPKRSGQRLYVFNFYQYSQLTFVIDPARLEREFRNRFHGPKFSSGIRLPPNFPKASDSELPVLIPGGAGKKSGAVGDSPVSVEDSLKLVLIDFGSGGHGGGR